MVSPAVIISSTLTILLAGSIHIFHESINLYLMGFFRDLSRIKARKRRMLHRQQQSLGLTTVDNSAAIKSGFTKNDLKMLFLKQEEEDPLIDIDIRFVGIHANGNGNGNSNGSSNANANIKINSVNGETIQVIKRTKKDHRDDKQETEMEIDLVEYTREELYEYGNGDNEEVDGQLLLSLYGRVYDVSEGYKYYGHGGKYHLFAGRDVTRALSTGCMAISCLGPNYTIDPSDVGRGGEDGEDSEDSDAFELTPKTIAEGKKWISFFETHDKYHFVGVLKDGRSMDDLIDQHLLDEQKELEQDEAEEEEGLDQERELELEREEEKEKDGAKSKS